MLTNQQALTLFKSSKFHSEIAPHLYGAGSDACVFKVKNGALKITSCPLTHRWLKIVKSTFTPYRVEIDNFAKNGVEYFAWEIEKLEKLSVQQSQYWERLKFELNKLNSRQSLTEMQKLNWLRINDTPRAKEWEDLLFLLESNSFAKVDVFTTGNVLEKNGLLVVSDPVRLLKTNQV